LVRLQISFKKKFSLIIFFYKNRIESKIIILKLATVHAVCCILHFRFKARTATCSRRNFFKWRQQISTLSSLYTCTVVDRGNNFRFILIFTHQNNQIKLLKKKNWFKLISFGSIILKQKSVQTDRFLVLVWLFYIKNQKLYCFLGIFCNFQWVWF